MRVIIGLLLVLLPASAAGHNPLLPRPQEVRYGSGKLSLRGLTPGKFGNALTLLGVGQAQVRHPASVASVPALQVASYAMLLLSMIRTESDPLPTPKWAGEQKPHRQSTQRAINQLRGEIWGRALGLTNFSDLVTCVPPTSNSDAE